MVIVVVIIVGGRGGGRLVVICRWGGLVVVIVVVLSGGLSNRQQCQNQLQSDGFLSPSHDDSEEWPVTGRDGIEAAGDSATKAV